MRRNALILLLIWAGAWSPQAAGETTWRVDPGPSSVEFRVRHLIFSQVEGSFRRFSGEVVVPDEDFAGASITTTIPVASIYTRHPDRDRELQGEEFFWASRYPEIHFRSTSIVRTGDRTYDVAGDLTIRGVTRPIVLKTERRNRSGSSRSMAASTPCNRSAEGASSRENPITHISFRKGDCR